jgi:hypothetical protein
VIEIVNGCEWRIEGWLVHAVCFDLRELSKRQKRRVFIETDKYG